MQDSTTVTVQNADKNLVRITLEKIFKSRSKIKINLFIYLFTFTSMGSTS